ncbi:glycosyltransferase family 32 protein [Melanogaster broomeanus]|nr:glycosyltransferase family 32 protein [Melanogaster broomeanus]
MSKGGYERLPMHSVSSPRSRSTARSRSPHRPSFLRPPSPHNHRSWYFPRPRTWFTALKILLPVLAATVFLGLFFYEPHIELAFYSREWIQSEIMPVEPLFGVLQPRPRVPMRFGMDCYDFAATIKPPAAAQNTAFVAPDERVQYHVYWRADLAPFGERQELMLKSFFATQNIDNSRLIMWSNGDLGGNPIIQQYLEEFRNSFELRVTDIEVLARGTALEGSSLLNSNDKKAWVDGDLVRLLAVWTYGGVWVDMDSLLTRDLAPLLEHEFVTQWDCYDKPYSALNGALMHFHKHSPYLCEAFHIMATSKPPRSDSTDWGSLLYLKLWRRLLAAEIPPFKILPFCFSDGRQSGKWTMGLGLEEGGGLDQMLGKVFSVHLHNQWEKEFPKGGWVERLLLRKYEQKLQGKK